MIRSRKACHGRGFCDPNLVVPDCGVLNGREQIGLALADGTHRLTAVDAGTTDASASFPPHPHVSRSATARAERSAAVPVAVSVTRGAGGAQAGRRPQRRASWRTAKLPSALVLAEGQLTRAVSSYPIRGLSARVLSPHTITIDRATGPSDAGSHAVVGLDANDMRVLRLR